MHGGEKIRGNYKEAEHKLKSVSASGQPPVVAGRRTGTLLESGYAHVINLRLRWLAGILAPRAGARFLMRARRGTGR